MHRRLILVLVAMAMVTSSMAAFGSTTRVVWGEDKEARTLDPRVSESRHEVQVFINIFDTLVFRTHDGTLYPYLAKSWEVNEDNTEFIFHLREDVTFHDGTPFNAEAVKYTFDSISDPELGSRAAIDYLGGEAYKDTLVVDEYTAKVRFHKPSAAFLIRCAHAWLSQVSPTAARNRPDEFAEHPVGTGPFMVVEWVRKDHVTLARNPDYNWAPEPMAHQGPAYLDELVFKEVRSAPTRVAALEEGEIDISDVTPIPDVTRLVQSGRFEVLTGSSPGLPATFQFNLDDPISADIYVRKAVNYAIDQASLVEKWAFGYRVPAYGILAPGTVGYWSGVENYYRYDPAMAREMLEMGGWEMGSDGYYYKDGQKCSLFAPAIFLETEQTIVQGELRKVGIDYQVTPISVQQEDEYVMDGVGNITIRWGDPDGSVLRVLLHSSNVPSPGVYGFNAVHISSPRIDELLDLAEAAQTLEERNDVFSRIQSYERELALTLPLSPVLQAAVYRKGLTGLRFDSRNHELLFYDARWED